MTERDAQSRPETKLPMLFVIMLRIAGLMVLAMMVLTFSDVVMRYFFSAPIVGAFELTEVLMGMMVFFAAPAMTYLGENITVTILSERMPPNLQYLSQRALDLVCALISAGLAFQLLRHGRRLLRFNEVTMELAIPKGFVAEAMAAGMAITAIAFLIRAVRGAPAAAEATEIV